MANYTTTRFTATETIGDSVIGLNMINSGAITISPKQGYVVTASDFSVDVPKAMLGESTVDNGGAVLTQNIPFTAVADEDIGGSSEQVLGIEIA